MIGATAVYGSRPINRSSRRTRAEIDHIRAVIHDVLRADNPMTARQVFYRLVSLSVIGKTEAEYKGTVIRLLGEMRLSGDLPFGWLADNTRWMRKSRSFDSAGEALRITAQTYRRAIWSNQPAYVEVWLEKDALAGVLLEVTDPYDVPLMVTRGYASLSYLYEAARALAAQAKPAHIYYFGDHDPSGLDITRATEQRLRQFAPEAEIHFKRVAVTTQQIRDFGLPTRPTKRSDTRARTFVGDSVEVDAIEPRMLRDLARACIERHLDAAALRTLELAEREERSLLLRITRILDEDPEGASG